MDDLDELVAVARMAVRHIAVRRKARVSEALDPSAIRRRVEAVDLNGARSMTAVAAELLDLIESSGVRSDHPRYFGLFNPPALPAAMAGELVASAVNPQLAAWSHAAGAVEVETRLVRRFASQVWEGDDASGSFTGGGSEANHLALLVALSRRYPAWARDGLPRSGPRPAIYASEESHLAWIKLARATGLGAEAVRLVPARDGLSLTSTSLQEAIAFDKDRTPVLVVATAGTTAHGAIDDIAGLCEVGHTHGAHVHVDAAWAGGLLVSPARRSLFEGIEAADSLTVDPHKWLAVPMGTGLFLIRDAKLLRKPFGVATGYMPAGREATTDPYVHSLQWSRRFNGAKLFMALTTMGVEGYEAMFSRQFALGTMLRDGLAKRGWSILNETALPLVCFAPPGATDDTVARIAEEVVRSGEAWISTVRLRGALALRACITSYETEPADVEALMSLVDRARDRVD